MIRLHIRLILCGVVSFLFLGTFEARAGLGEVVEKPVEHSGVSEKKADVSVPLPSGGEEGGVGDSGHPVGALAEGGSEKPKSVELRMRIAQLMMVTLQGLYAPDSTDKAFLKNYTPGGVILPALVKPDFDADFICDLREKEVNSIPLFIGVDMYDRTYHSRDVHTSFFQLPSLLSIAAGNDAESVKQLAKLTAEQLSLVGFNMQWGPSLVLAPTLPEAKGNIHTLGSDAAFAGTITGSLLDALQEKKILSVPIGFPGGGANRIGNTPAVLLTPRAQLLEQDLLPYKVAIEHGTQMIHVGNTLTPLLDPNNRPASISPLVMKELLRQQLGFNGIIVAGPMDSQDMVGHLDPTEAAIQAILAGADMVYWNQADTRVMKTIDEMVKAVENGRIPEAVINAAFGRIVAVKELNELAKREKPSTRKAAAIENQGRFANEAYTIERRSITLIQNRGNVLPFTKKKSTPLGIIGFVGTDELFDVLESKLRHVGKFPIATAKHMGEIQDFDIHRVVSTFEGVRTLVCIFPNSEKYNGQVRLIDEFKKMGKQVVVILMGYPSTVEHYVQADALVLTYCENSGFEQSMKAVADLLLGNSTIRILPPVRDLETQVGKEEEFNVLDVVRSPSGRLPVTAGSAFKAGYSVPFDTEPRIKKVLWEFGDGKRSKKMKLTHAYETPGRYPVTLTVTDKKKQVTKGVFNILVK